MAGKIVGSTSLLAAVAYHFGREYTFRRVTFFGLDPGVMGFSTQDFIVRSGDALFVAIGALVMLAAVILGSHWVILKEFQGTRRRLLRPLGYLARLSGLILFFVGVAALFVDPHVFPPRWAPFIEPMCAGIGALLFAYSFELLRSDSGATAPTWLRSAGLILVGLLLLLSLFLEATVWAHELGTGRSASLAKRLDSLPSVEVFSKQKIYVSGPGVKEIPLANDKDAAYRFRYTGLRLYASVNGRYFLLPEGWSRSKGGSAIVLKDEPGLRLEFRPGRIYRR